jgi:CRP/FNR family transcriptional regulator, cyclic AMP receptor protein
MGADLRSAVSMSRLRELPPEVLDELLAGSTRMTVLAGSVTHWEGEPEPHLELVLAGVVRVFVTARDGRTMTVRYCRPGALIGVMSLFATGFAMPATTQALVDAEVLRISATVARGMGTRDLRVARAFLGELSERALSFVYEIPGGAFATVRQRVVRHLLDLASARVGEQPAPDHRAGRELTSRSASRSWRTPWARFGRSSCGSCATCARTAWCGPSGTGSCCWSRHGSSRNRGGTKVPDGGCPGRRHCAT